MRGALGMRALTLKFKQMKKNIAFQKTPANDGLPTGWYKEPGLPIWYTAIFGIKFRITNAHETALGMWFIEYPGCNWTQMDLLPGAKVYTLEKDSVVIFETALKQIRGYFLSCIARIDYKLQNQYHNERDEQQ